MRRGLSQSRFSRVSLSRTVVTSTLELLDYQIEAMYFSSISPEFPVLAVRRPITQLQTNGSQKALNIGNVYRQKTLCSLIELELFQYDQYVFSQNFN